MGNKLILCTAIGLSALAEAPSHAQTTIIDGGFDTQAASVSEFCYNNDCPNGSWLLYGGAGFVHQGQAGWPAPVPVSPSHVLFLQGDQSLVRQTFTAPATGPYVVVYSLASRPDYGSVAGNQTVMVRVAGQLLARTALTSGRPFARYVSSMIALTAGASYLLYFAGGSEWDQNGFVDSVSIVPASSTTSYRYDALGRLTAVAHAGGAIDGTSTAYTYDKAGNRTNASVSGAH